MPLDGSTNTTKASSGAHRRRSSRLSPALAARVTAGVTLGVLLLATGPAQAHEPGNKRHRGNSQCTTTSAAPTSSAPESEPAAPPTTAAAAPPAEVAPPALPTAPVPAPLPEPPVVAAPGGAGAGGVGVPAGVVLTPYNGTLKVDKPGTVIDSMDVSGGIEITANDVTIKNTRVRGNGGPAWGIQITPGVTGALIEDTEIGGGDNGVTQTGVGAGMLFGSNSGPAGAATNVARRVDIHHTVDGLRMDGNATFADSRIRDLSFTDGVHSDGIQSTGWSNMVISGNTIEGGTNDAVFLNAEGDNPPITNVDVLNNRLVGKSGPGGVTSYGLRAESGETVTAAHNVFAGEFQAGPANEGVDWETWVGNTVEGVGVLDVP